MTNSVCSALMRVGAAVCVHAVENRTHLLNWRRTLQFGVAFGLIFSAEVHAVEPYQEYRKRIESAQNLTALNGGALGDSVSLYNGATEFQATDIDVPGNNALPVRLSRRFVVKLEPAGQMTYNPDLGGAGNWDIEVPYITGMFASQYPWTSDYAGDRRCSAMTTPSVPSTFTTSEMWQGYSVHVPGEGDRTLLLSESQTLQPNDGVARRWSTRERDTFTCIPMVRGMSGEGFSMVTAAGVRYDFNIAVSRGAGTLTRVYKSQYLGTIVVPFQRERIFLLASKITDRFGNTVDISYNAAGHPTQISSSDGRSISLGYQNGQLATATSAGRSWIYRYVVAADQTVQMTEAERPDGSRWTYEYIGTLRPDYEPWDGSSNSTCSIKPPAIFADYEVKVRHPGGAVGAFSFSNTRHFRSGVHASECLVRSADESQYWILNTPNYFDVMSLESKSITGPGIRQSMVWTYDYGRSAQALWGTNGQPAAYPCTTCPSEKTVVVTNPDNTVSRYRYGFQYALNEGRLLGHSIYDAAGVLQRTDATTYLSEADAGLQSFHSRYGMIINGDDPSTAAVRPVVASTVQQDGVTFSMQVRKGCGTATAYCFDPFARTLSVDKSSSLGYAKTEATEFHDDLGRWVLGQVKRQLVNGTEVSRTDYDAVARPWKTYQFGRHQQTFAYNTDGTLASVTDGRGLATSLSEWKRGMPQKIVHADSTSQSATVDDSGWLRTVVNEAGSKSCYDYDPLGRVKLVTQPSETQAGVCDSTAWNATVIRFESVNADEYGIGSGHWRRTEETGNARKVTYFDALWRPVLTREYDTADVNGTSRFTAQAFDHDGRVVFAGYPVASVSTVAGVTQGTHMTYDALGRVRTSTAHSEHGPLTTAIEYLTGFKRQTTNPRGEVTVETFQVFDQPVFDFPVQIDAPEQTRTKIVRDVFGKPLNMTRGTSN